MKLVAYTQSLKLILAVALLLHKVKSHKTYYVKPSSDYSCTYHYCDTLSGYIKHSEIFQNIDRSITMTFLSRIHRLSENLVFTRLNGLVLNGKVSRNSHIQCSAQVYLKFTGIDTLEVNNLTISNCGGLNRVSQRAPVVMLAQDIYQLFITNSHFSANNYTSAISASRINEMIISKCSFDRNEALYSNGGAISVFGAAKVEIRECNFTNNHQSGAVYVTESRKVIISNSRFVNNSANCRLEECNYGGAISIFGLIDDTYLTTVVLDEHNLFEHNIALMSGGGLYAQQLSLNISGEAIFRNNTAHFNHGGGLAIHEGVSVIISNSNFTNNEGNIFGGAVSISDVLYIT